MVVLASPILDPMERMVSVTLPAAYRTEGWGPMACKASPGCNVSAKPESALGEALTGEAVMQVFVSDVQELSLKIVLGL